jgi:hypothetical protein
LLLGRYPLVVRAARRETVANLKQLAQASLGFVGLPRFALNQDMYKYMYIWEAGTICIHKSPTNFVTITSVFAARIPARSA